MPYLSAMALPRPARPSALLSDLRAFLASDQRHRLLIGIIAVLMPLVIIFLFLRDGQSLMPTGPQITYAADWSNTRTDDEIRTQQKIDQAAKDKAEADKRAAFQRLAKQLGID
jgi:hypothetical protein